MGDTSRLYKILVKEREREELEILGRKQSAFKYIKRTLSKRFIFKKFNPDPGETEENNFCGKVFKKGTNSFIQTK